ncbi:uncharacterized protein [Dendrobates tinctorius]|uniref:uncharacterized protein n=1 Tax=Dendrobates tinctorius TaxID=92724 RepID=UPI003CCA0FB1
MMGRKGVISVLVIIAGLLLSDHGAKGQTTESLPTTVPQESTTTMPTTAMPATTMPISTSQSTTTLAFQTTTALAFESTTTVGTVLGGHSCPSYTQNREAICSSVSGTSDIATLLKSDSEFTGVCDHSMLQYGCAQIEGLPAASYAKVLECFLRDDTVVTSQEAYSYIMDQIPVDTLGDTVNMLNDQVSSADISENNKKYFLNAVWLKVIQNPENFNPGYFATWISRLYLYIPSIDNIILDCITSLALSSDNFESIVMGLSVSYPKFDQSKKEQIALWITDCLRIYSYAKTNPADSMKAFYSVFLQNVDFTSISAVFTDAQMATATDILTDFQLAQYCVASKSFSSYETALSILQILSGKDFTFVFNFLSTLPADNYGQEISYSLLYTALIKLNASDDPICRPKITIIFQAKLSYLLKYVNSSILDLIVFGDCSDYQAVYGAIDGVYSNLSNDSQILLFNYRKNYLNSEVQKSGSACTYGVSSSEWFVLNLGASSSYFLYADMIRFNPKFDGFATIENLTLNQCMGLIEASEILTSPSPIDYEIRISAVISYLENRGYETLQLFLIKVKAYLIQFNIQFIVNFNVRSLFLQGFWGILEHKFAEFTSNDWLVWYTDYLSFTLSAITKQQLSILSNGVVEGCSNMQFIVGGFDAVIGQMKDEAKTDVTDWIVGYLQNDTSRCVQTGENWLEINFKQFKGEVSVTIIKELNPDFDLIESLYLFNADQIAQTVFILTEAHSNVTLIVKIFSYLIVENDIEKTIENCGQFWEGFNKQLSQTDDFTAEVKVKLLELTTAELSLQYSIFTSEQWYLWFAIRFKFVIPQVTVDNLAQIPLNISCDSYQAVIYGLSGSYEETGETSRDAVYNFIISFFTKGTKCFDSEVSTVSFMETFVGYYRFMFTYEQLIQYFIGFNAFEEGVLSTMSVEQIGDMMVVANVYESLELAGKAFAYLETLPIESVDICFAQFTATAIKNNINIVNFSVGQFILQSYLTIIQPSLATYSHAQTIQLFQNRISIFIKFFTKSTLESFAVEDCDTLAVIVNELDKGFSSMTLETQQDIASWIMDRLKSSNLNGCGSIYQTTSVWVESTMKSFVSVVPITQIKEVFSEFDVIAVINSTSVLQKVEFIFSNQGILASLETVNIVLASFYEGDNVVTTSEIYSFCYEFNQKYEGLTVQNMSYEVQQEIFTFLFTSWIQNLNSMSAEQILLFEENFKFFLSGVSVTALNVIPAKMGCNVYHTIFSALSSVIKDLSENMKKSIFDAMIIYLDAQSTGSSDVCGILYTDSVTYVTNIFFGFFEYASSYQMAAYYGEFNVYAVLPLCSGEQLGNLFMSSTAITNEFEAIQIFVDLGKRDFQAISSFLTECTRIAKEKEIVSLPNANIASYLYNAVWKTMSEHLKTEADFQWFSENALLIISSVTAESINAIQAPDCNSQRFLIGAFSKVYSKQDKSQRDSMYENIKEFNEAQIERSGSACKTDSGNSSDWVSFFYGSYDEMASYQEFKQYNPDFSARDALVVFSGTQCADYCIDVGGLKVEEIILAIYESFDSAQKVEEFLVQLNAIAAVELHSSAFVSVILSRSIEIISVDFITFTVEEWTYWFQVVFGNILYVITESDIQHIGFPLPCASYQSLVQALTIVYNQMSEDVRKTVYNSCIRPQLSTVPVVNGVRCGEGIVRTQEWMDINIGDFSIYGDIKEFEQWNINFKSVDVINTVSPDQLAVIAVENIVKEEVACQVAGRVQQFEPDEAKAFLDSFSAAFNMSTVKISYAIGYKLLSSSIIALKSVFVQYSSSDWESLFSAKINHFLSSMNGEVLTSILDSADCSGYFVITKYLNFYFDDFSADTQQELVGCLTDFLKRQPTGTCPMSGESSVVASMLFGKFTYLIPYENLPTYITNFDGLQAIDLLSPSQKGSLAFTGDILNDESKAQILANSIQTMSFQQVDQFLISFVAIAEQRGFTAIANVQVGSIIFNTIYGIISKEFLTWNADQWNSYFTIKLSIILSCITESQIGMIPLSISCSAYQSVISGLSQQYSKLYGTTQTAVAEKAKSYLGFNKPDFGPKCPVSSGGSGAWLNINLAIFSDLCSKEEISALYPGFSFTDAVGYLTAGQLGYVMASPEYLSDKDKCSKILNAVTPLNLGEFLDAFNDGLAKNGITQISNVQVRKLFEGEVFCKLGSMSSSFTATDYQQWFGKRLETIIPSMDAKAFGAIPLDISCDSLAAIMKALNAVANPENPEAIFDFCYSVLEAQKASSGVACTSAAMSSSQWLTTFMGQYIPQATWNQIITVNPTIVLTEVRSQLTTTQWASASSTITNTADFTSMVYSFSGTLDDFKTFLVTVCNDKNSDLCSNSKVREFLLMMTAKFAFAKFTDFGVQETQSWMNVINYMLPSINSTILELLPKEMSCENFQVVVGACSKQYYSLSPVKRQDIANFIKEFLLNKLTTENDSCSNGLSIIDYIQKNCGLFCNQLKDGNVTELYSALDPVSFTQVCSLS